MLYVYLNNNNKIHKIIILTMVVSLFIRQKGRQRHTATDDDNDARKAAKSL